MEPSIPAKVSIDWYISDMTSRIIAKTGIPSDRYHLGKVILQSLKDFPNFVLQIDAATGKSETCKSALERSVRCALSLKKMGLKCGDVIAVIANHYLELAVLYYSALYLGIKIATIDPSHKVFEVKEMLQVNRASIIFSQNSKIDVVKEAMELINLQAKIVSIDDGSDVMSFSKFTEECGNFDVDVFRPTDFDPEETIATLMSSSGTTGLPKVVASTHKNYLTSVPLIPSFTSKPCDTYFLSSPVQWISSMFQHLFAPILRYTKIQTSHGYSAEHYIDIINKYQPQIIAISPAAMFSLIDPRMKIKLDLKSVKTISIGGSVVPHLLFDDLQKIAPNAVLLHVFGASEAGLIFRVQYTGSSSLGRPLSCFSVKLVVPETLEDIIEPNVNGELWITGPAVAKGYYNNPVETKAAFVDGWFRTGDIFYRDEQYSFYYVDRLKLLLKYRTHHVSPVECEKVLREHPGVMDVAVVGIPDLECGDLPAACVIPNPDDPPTAQEIKHYVKEKLSDAKQLRGGVIFMDEFPLTVTSKLDRGKLKTIAINAKRE